LIRYSTTLALPASRALGASNGLRRGTEVKAISQLCHRSEPNKRTLTFSAWAMSILFACIAATSFAVDQSMMISTASGWDGTSFGLGECLGEIHPLRLLESLAGQTQDQQ
jgi:hypothetical protein